MPRSVSSHHPGGVGLVPAPRSVSSHHAGSAGLVPALLAGGTLALPGTPGGLWPTHRVRRGDRPVARIGLTPWTARRPAALALLLLLSACLTPARAEDRALIIGIGLGYGGSVRQIAGPARDVALATTLAERLGFHRAQIRILAEKEATKAAILTGLRWLVEGVQAGEKAFIHYSGHGTRRPTPTQECTAALVPVDFTGTEEHLLLKATEFNTYLQPLRARATVILLLDACFSGGVTRSLTTPAPEVVKYHAGTGQLGCDKAVNAFVVPQTGTRTALAADGLIALTATADNELAFGDLTSSGKGSLFTQALADILAAHSQPPQHLTFQALRAQAAARISDVSRRYKYLPHTPQLLGNATLFTRAVTLERATPLAQRSGSLDEAQNLAALLRHLVLASKFQVALQTPEARVPLGQDIRLTLESSKPGYVHLLAIEPTGDVTLLFPNTYQPEHQVVAQRVLRVPEDVGKFRFEALEPLGQSRVVALVTPTPLNLAAQGTGKALDGLRQLSSADFAAFKGQVTRAIGVKPPRVAEAAQSRGDFGAAEVVLEVVARP